MAKKPLRVISHNPVGTREELAELRLHPAQYGSCSRPEKDHAGDFVNRGCDYFDECELRHKAGLWPKNGAVRFVKDTADGTRKVVQWKDNCFGFMSRKEDYEARGPYDWIAEEGEEIRELGSVFKDENIPGQGMVRIVEDTILTSKIAPFPRPGKSENLVKQAFANEVAENSIAKKKAKRSENPLGLEEQIEARKGKA